MRRIRRLSVASAIGATPTMTIIAQHWRELEQALEKKVPLRLRAEIIGITDNFLSWGVFEHAAVPVTGAERRLEALTKAGNNFLKTLASKDTGDARRLADYLVETHFMHHRFRPRGKVVDFCEVVRSFVEACRKASADLPLQAEWRPGDCWSDWIVKITAVLKRNGIPTSARKDTDKHPGKVSAFVMFIERLQRLLPTQYSRATHSRIALAEAITKARRFSRVSKRKP